MERVWNVKKIWSLEERLYWGDSIDEKYFLEHNDEEIAWESCVDEYLGYLWQNLICLSELFCK